MGASAIDVTGLPETRNLLRRFEPDLLKRLDSHLNAVARDLCNEAQVNFSATGVRGSAYRVKSKTRAGGFSKAVTTMPGSVGRGERWSSEPGVLASIFELANAVRDSKPQNIQRTRSLIATLNARYGRPGRFLWEAWDESKDEALGSIKAEVEAIEAEYSARLRR